MSFSSFIRRDSAESVRSVIHNSDLHANLLGDDETDDEEPLKPFCRWVSTLRRRKKHQSTPSVTPRSERWMLDGFDDITANTPLESRPLHAKSGSLSSSIQFVAGVKSATVTLASASIAPLSQGGQANGAVPTTAAASYPAPIQGPQSILSARYSTKLASYGAGSAEKSWRSSSGRKKATSQISGHCRMYGC